MKITYSTTTEFEKDFKKLEKRFRTLSSDFECMKKNLLETHYLKGIKLPLNSLVDIEGCCSNIYRSQKVRRFACKSLKNFGSYSGIRVILVFEKDKMKITFVEIYYKGDKENEDRNRLKLFLENKY